MNFTTIKTDPRRGEDARKPTTLLSVLSGTSDGNAEDR
jgi:hypothetical protein